MKVTALFTDDRAVSSTIAIVLLVAVTVILAAIVAGFAFGLLGSTNSAPNTEFGWEFNGSGEGVAITHQSGDTLDGDRLSFGDGWNEGPSNCEFNRGDQLSGGDLIVGNSSGSDDLCRHEAGSDTTLELIWTSENAETGTIITERTTP
jgi:flagellin-like protein